VSVDPVDQWTRPMDGYISGDLDFLSDLPPHTELIDGGLVFVSPQRRFHENMLTLLRSQLQITVPSHLDVVREMSIVLTQKQRPVPDLSVIECDALGDGSESWYPGAAVQLVVEVVSPESRERDRKRKPRLYAEAGIPHFWVVEEAHGRPVVHVHQLDRVRSAYTLTGIFHERLKLAVPYDMDIDLEGKG
jgi:Uma2 family endonuclease